MAKKKATSEPISDKKLKELFDGCDGRRSHYLILTGEPQEFLDAAVEQGWIIPLGNSSNRPWFTASMNLITKFRDLEKHEQKQEEAYEASQIEQQRIDVEEEARAQKAIADREAVSLSAGESSGRREEHSLNEDGVRDNDADEVEPANNDWRVHPEFYISINRSTGECLGLSGRALNARYNGQGGVRVNVQIDGNARQRVLHNLYEETFYEPMTADVRITGGRYNVGSVVHYQDGVITGVTHDESFQHNT